MKSPRIGFFAFPSNPAYVGEVIEDAAQSLNRDELILTPWSEISVTGIKIDNLIRDRITSVDLLLADITYPNFNVYYEI